jgi:hypothetical protein
MGERQEGKLLQLVKQMDRAGERGRVYIVYTGKYISTQSFLFRIHFPLHPSDSFLGFDVVDMLPFSHNVLLLLMR